MQLEEIHSYDTYAYLHMSSRIEDEDLELPEWDSRIEDEVASRIEDEDMGQKAA